MTGTEPVLPGRGTVPAPVEQERSIGELMGDVSRDLSTLLRQEVELAKAELRESGSRVGKGAGLLTGAAVGGHFAILFLSIALWWGLGTVIGMGWSAVVVAVLWGVVAAILAVRGRAELNRVKGLPKTAETVSKIPNALKGNEEDNR